MRSAQVIDILYFGATPFDHIAQMSTAFDSIAKMSTALMSTAHKSSAQMSFSVALSVTRNYTFTRINTFTLFSQIYTRAWP